MSRKVAYLPPESIRFRIIDADGNEAAVASLNLPLHHDPLPQGGREGEKALNFRWDGNRIILTWYATEPVKGFYIFRSTLSPSVNGKIFHYT